MATSTQYARRCRFDGCGGLRAALTWLVMALLVCLPGCGGCRKTPEQLEKEKQEADEREKEKEKEKKKKETPPFEAGQPYVLPTNIILSAGMYKPGHWINHTWPDLKSNLGDLQGEIQTQVTEFSNGENNRVKLLAVPYQMTDQRPAALAKEQPKALESFMWIPRQKLTEDTNYDRVLRSVDFKLTTMGGATAIEVPMSLKAMPSYQYKFVVLSKGSRFDYLSKRLESIRRHRVSLDGREPPIYYQVVTMPPAKRPILPTTALCWTSIAYLLWDESDPALWDLDQQQALVDWLHWGGQLIISGPDALQQLQSSFLRQYLPATVGKARTFDAKDLQEFQYWSCDIGTPREQVPRLSQPWPGAELKKDPDPRAKYLPYTNDTVIERLIGRGRIVVTAFRITGPDFSGWEGCDCFFNACIMRRGPREVAVESPTFRTPLRWVEPAESNALQKRISELWNAARDYSTKANGQAPALRDLNAPAPPSDDNTSDVAQVAPSDPINGPTPFPKPATNAMPLPIEPANRTLSDAATNTALRYFSRDAGVSFDDYALDVVRSRRQARSESSPMYYPSGAAPAATVDADSPTDGDDQIAGGEPGLCAWNDFSPVAETARNALENATGVTVPPRSFIVWVVVSYLCILVPANWFFFRLIRRVEWAWIAAPLIAVGCTVVVVHQAQLNLGFAQSRNEIAIVEMQPGYPRAHLTRYTALYTSLGTSYDLKLADPAGQVLPFSLKFAPSDFDLRQFGLAGSYRDVVCRRGDDTRLSGIHVDSNSKEYVHSEEMADFGGTVTLHHDSDGSLRVTNGTKHPLENCQVIRAGESDRMQIAMIDRLEPGATAKLKLDAFKREPTLVAPYVVKPVSPTGELNDEGVRFAALHLQELRPEEVCLVARVSDGVSGLTVVPEVPQKQFRQAALLVAHLDPGTLSPPARDETRRSNARPQNSPNSVIPQLDEAE